MPDSLYVVRHAETVLGARGVVNGDPSVPNGLTEKGRAQAQDVAERLAGETIDTCVTTEFIRTKETAALILEGRDVETVAVTDLNDPRQGKFEGQPFEFYAQWMETTGMTDRIPGGGESQLDAVTRYAKGWRTVCEIDGDVLVVAHAFPISVARELHDGSPPLLKRNYERDPEFAELNVLSKDRLLQGLDILDEELREFRS